MHYNYMVRINKNKIQYLYKNKTMQQYVNMVFNQRITPKTTYSS